MKCHVTIFLLCLILLSHVSLGQESSADSIVSRGHQPHHSALAVRHPLAAPVIASSLFAGTTPFFMESARRQNILLREEMQLFRRTHFDHRQLHFDNVLQYLPYCSAIGLKLLGVPSSHTTGQLLFRTAASMATTMVVTHSLKSLVTEWRPDRGSSSSFPSGHTAFAFAGAEMLRLEYSETSVLIPAAAFLVAATTGIMRVYNDRHWTGDVLAGAAIGILTTDLSWLLTDCFHSRSSRHAPQHSHIAFLHVR